MKAAFVDQYTGASSFLRKDPVTIPLGLPSLGRDVTLINSSSIEVDSQVAGLNVFPRSAFDPTTWADGQCEVTDFFSFDARSDEAIKAAEAVGTKGHL